MGEKPVCATATIPTLFAIDVYLSLPVIKPEDKYHDRQPFTTWLLSSKGHMNVDVKNIVT
jgi:hypothetical protein